MLESRLHLNIDYYISLLGTAHNKVKIVLIKQLSFQLLVNLDPFF